MIIDNMAKTTLL